MNVYFADRQLNIIGQASTNLPGGVAIISDKKTGDVETGVSVFECEIPFDKKTRSQAMKCTEVGNYVLRNHNGENELYSIIDAEVDTKKQRIYIYAEDDGMDLLNEVVGPYTADQAYPIAHYIDKYAAAAGFEIGINEASDLTRKLSWDGEATATERIASVATQFDGCEVSYSFDVSGLHVVRKHINIYKQRGKDIGITLRLNQDIDNIVTTKSIANLATALQCKGGTPEDENFEDDVEPVAITLDGYEYDDGDFYVENGVLKSREALKRWSRFLWKTEDSQKSGGHITKQFSYDTLSQETLCARAITELKKIRDMEVNYEVDITKFPDNVKIGDRINIVDDAGELYVSARVLKLESSVVDQEHKATLGEYLIKSSGIHQKVLELAAQFAAQAASAEKALQIANTAKQNAENAKNQANEALNDAAEAKKDAEEAMSAAEDAQESANDAQEAATNAQNAVDAVEKSIAGMEKSIANAEEAAEQARQAALTAETKVEEARQSAEIAQDEAERAAAAAEDAEEMAAAAVAKAETAQGTAEQATAYAEAAATTAAAARLDAEQAQKDIDALGQNLTTLENTMSANYARKTDLTEAEAKLQSRIAQNAAEISFVVTKQQVIDETVNNAAELAAQAQAEAKAAKAEADRATADAEAAQATADEAWASANDAQSAADEARTAADTAQSVADEAEAALAAAQADLETIEARGDATAAEIAEAEEAVAAAQTAANIALADAEIAIAEAEEAQSVANEAVANAEAAQQAANEAAAEAEQAQQVANEANNAAVAADVALTAATVAGNAQGAADAARTEADYAQAQADLAAQQALDAQETATTAATQMQQAEADLAEAEERLADVLASVDSTQEEVEAAQADVDRAQELAAVAREYAETAQEEADAARANANAAQAAANEATTAANAAQEAANAAINAANQAQDDVNELAVRITTAETKIIQTSEQISLLASKTEVAEMLGGYSTKEEMQAAIRLQADEITSSVSKTYATQEVVQSVQSGVSEAQRIATSARSAAEDAASDAEAAQAAASSATNTANSAKDTANSAANTANSAANTAKSAQTTANNAQTAANQAQTTANNLVTRVTTAESSIKQNANQIALMAKKSDITEALGDYSTTEEMQAQIDLSAEAITSSVSKTYATQEELESASTTIKQLSDNISMLVTDGNGTSLMQQTESGWSFSTANIQSAINSASEQLNDLVHDLGSTDAVVSVLQQAVSDIGTKTDYINIGTYTITNEQGTAETVPCIELGESDSEYKLLVTNKQILFQVGSSTPTRIDTDGVVTENITVEYELRQKNKAVSGYWFWSVRANGNYGLQWKGDDT